MGWESRKYGDGPRGLGGDGGGGFRAGLRRVFGDGENPLLWAFPLYTAWGIRVRISVWFVLFAMFELIWSLTRDRIGFPYMAIGMGSLFLLVLLHEYGHCIACRRVGGTADQILMWPLGGLASCSPPHRWKADLITTLGGPGVNLLLWPVFGAALLALGQGWESVLFNPFRPSTALTEVMISMGGRGPAERWGTVVLWWLYYTNAVLFCFNMLLAMYPFDAGRVVHALLWRQMGHRRATDIVTKVGMGVAVALVVFAITFDTRFLLGIALFGGYTCWAERQRLKMAAGDPALEGYDFERGFQGFPDDDEDDEAQRRRERRRQKEEEEQAELDRILAKIASSGMGSLTGAEKRWLQRATERRRRV
jgi:Zn-dependent protease